MTVDSRYCSSCGAPALPSLGERGEHTPEPGLSPGANGYPDEAETSAPEHGTGELDAAAEGSPDADPEPEPAPEQGGVRSAVGRILGRKAR